MERNKCNNIIGGENVPTVIFTRIHKMFGLRQQIPGVSCIRLSLAFCSSFLAYNFVIRRPILLAHLDLRANRHLVFKTNWPLRCTCPLISKTTLNNIENAFYLTNTRVYICQNHKTWNLSSLLPFVIKPTLCIHARLHSAGINKLNQHVSPSASKASLDS